MPTNESAYGHIDAPLQTHQTVWAIGGGKGGVGKSMLSANLSISLALSGLRVVAIDLDLGGANLHTTLGLPIPNATLSDFFNRSIPRISDVVTETEIENLGLISGAQDQLGVANLQKMQRNRLLGELQSLDADYLLFDLGAGTTQNTLDFFIHADQGILVVLPEPTSIENTYRFIKSAFFHKLNQVDGVEFVRPKIDRVLNSKMGQGDMTPRELIDHITEVKPELGQRIKTHMQRFCPKLVVNQVRCQDDIDLGMAIQSVCYKYFGLSIEFIGYLDYDTTVWQSVKKRRPLLLENPSGIMVQRFEELLKKLL